MSFQDSAFIFFIALLLFGPKKLPELARQLGKLMGEFRRASNEFRMQLEDELRTSEQAEKQKKIAALEAAKTPDPVAATQELPAVSPAEDLAQDHALPIVSQASSGSPDGADASPEQQPEAVATSIATAGGLELHAPATGLPVSRNGSVGEAFDSIPEAPPDRSLAGSMQASESPRQPDLQEPAHHG